MRVRVLSLTALAAAMLSATAAFAGSPEPVHFAIMSPGNVPDGAAKGTGAASVQIVAKDTLCFTIIVDGLDTPTLSHIHSGIAGVNGDPVVTLTPPGQGDQGTSSGCISGLDPQVLAKINKSPASYYVNVHTTLFPSGAIRGQLF